MKRTEIDWIENRKFPGATHCVGVSCGKQWLILNSRSRWCPKKAIQLRKGWVKIYHPLNSKACVMSNDVILAASDMRGMEASYWSLSTILGIWLAILGKTKMGDERMRVVKQHSGRIRIYYYTREEERVQSCKEAFTTKCISWTVLG